MFNKLKEVGGKLKERSLSIRSDSANVPGASFSSGFICPECKQSFWEAEQLQSHWLVCLKSDNLETPRSNLLTELSQSEEDVDLAELGADELRNQLIETRCEKKRIERSHREVMRKSGGMAVELTRLQMELDDVTTKCVSVEQMGLTLQETYIAQVKRNEELRELLEQRSMTSPDDVHVLTRELSHLHALLSEKEGDWERRLGEMGANLLQAQKQNGVLEQRLSADRTEALTKETETRQVALTATQLELRTSQEETKKLANQLSQVSETRDQLTQQLTEKQVEVSRLLAEKESNQSQAEISTQLERCLESVAADKQELIDKIGSEALSGVLSDTILKQTQSDLSEARSELKLERESAVGRETQLTSRHSTELRERDAQLAELKGRMGSLMELNDSLKSEVRERQLEERQQANQLIESRQEVGQLTNQLAEGGERAGVELERIREQLTGVKSELADTQTRLSELEREKQQLTELSQTLQTDKSQLENQLTQEQRKCTDLELELETARADFIELNQLIDRKEEEVARMVSRAEKSEEDLRNTLELKNSLSNQILEMDCGSQQLREQLESKSVSCSDQLVETERLSGELEQLEQQLEAGRDGMKKQSEEHESVKSLLIEQKLDLQRKVSVAEERVGALEEKVTADQRERERLLAEAETEKQLVLERGDRNALESAELKNELRQERTRAHLTAASQQQEIRAMKAEVESGDGQRVRLQGKLDQQFGKMAVMDAKVQSLRDENQHLIGAQIERDKEIEQYRILSHQLEIELGEVKSALYELGKQQQNAALKDAKMADRKWQDDTLAEWCNACHKKFSLSIRKHHCRNCGKIFCQDCTPNQTILPSSKSRARVCEACYSELA